LIEVDGARAPVPRVAGDDNGHVRVKTVLVYFSWLVQVLVLRQYFSALEVPALYKFTYLLTYLLTSVRWNVIRLCALCR